VGTPDTPQAIGGCVIQENPESNCLDEINPDRPAAARAAREKTWSRPIFNP